MEPKPVVNVEASLKFVISESQQRHEEVKTLQENSVRKQLLTPDDFMVLEKIRPLKTQLATPDDFQTFQNNSNSQKCASHYDDTNNVTYNEFLEKLLALSKTCENVFEFEKKLLTVLPSCLHCAVLPLLMCSLSKSTLHELSCSLLQKVSATNTFNCKSAAGRKHSKRKFPIGVFWDIENCQVPSGKSAFDVVQKVRKCYYMDHMEVEFMAVCDIKKEGKRIIQELNDAQVNVVHVNAIAKNAADDKLRQSIQRYASNHAAPGTVIIITGDCNFSPAVSDLRFRHNYFVVLIHKQNAPASLVQAATSTVCFEEFVLDLPFVHPVTDTPSDVHLLVSNLPSNEYVPAIRDRLRHLSSNCGGKVQRITPPTALIKFSTPVLARRALKRLKGEDVFGSKISVRAREDNQEQPSSSNKRHKPHCNKEDAERLDSCVTCPKEEISEIRDEKRVDVDVVVSNIDSRLGAEKINKTIYEHVSALTTVTAVRTRQHNRFTMVCDVTVTSVDGAMLVLQHLHRRKIGEKRILVAMAPSTNSTDFKLLQGTESVCQHHYIKPHSRCQDMKINLPLREFSAKVHTLLLSHGGHLFLKGFERCYVAKFGSFPSPKDNCGGVFLEHQLSYVPGVRLLGEKHKTIVWSQAGRGNVHMHAAEFSKSRDLTAVARQVASILKVHPGCCLPLQEFESLCNKEMASQLSACGVADASEAVASLPHVLQVFGVDCDIITLTHRAQVKRFTQEIVQVLKTCPDRAMLVTQLPHMYHKTFNRSWNLVDFGVNSLSDLLDDIPDGKMRICGQADNVVLSLHIREQTEEEVMQTARFSEEVIEVLSSLPSCRIHMSDFVPSYHKQYGRQLKLSRYGFDRLLDLFESISDTAKIIDGSDEKFLQLSDQERLKVLTSQILQAIRKPSWSDDADGVPLKRLQSVYARRFGFPLVPYEYDCLNMEDLLRRIANAVTMVCVDDDVIVRSSECKPMRLLTTQLLVLLLDIKQDKLYLESFYHMYKNRYREEISPLHYGFLSLECAVKKALAGFAKVEGGAVHLRPVYQCAKRIRNVLLSYGGAMTLGDFNRSYRLAHNNQQLDADGHGFQSCEALLRALPSVVTVKGFGIKKSVHLRHHMKYGPLSSSLSNGFVADENISTSMDKVKAGNDDSSSSSSSL